VRVRAYLYIYIYIYTYTYVHVYIYMCIHIDRHIYNTQARSRGKRKCGYGTSLVALCFTIRHLPICVRGSWLVLAYTTLEGSFECHVCIYEFETFVRMQIQIRHTQKSPIYVNLHTPKSPEYINVQKYKNLICT